jgi:2-methylaconitate cis-trans-isomerase PrpF
MRGGKFLAEQSPDEMLEAHMCDTLEDVFLKLSKLQNQGKRRRSSYMLEVMGPPKPEEVSSLTNGNVLLCISSKYCVYIWSSEVNISGDQ